LQNDFKFDAQHNHFVCTNNAFAKGTKGQIIYSINRGQQTTRADAIVKLWKLRKSGVELRNDPPAIYDGGVWLGKGRSWHAEVLTTAQAISEGLKNHLETMNEMGPAPANTRRTTPLHQHYVQVMSEILRRMDKFLEKEV
jgi:hypothetical protein